MTSPALETLVVRDDIGRDAWNAFVTRHPDGTVEHLWEWRSIFTSVFGHETAYLAATRAGAVVGVLPLVSVASRLFGRSLVSLPYANYAGLITSDAEAAPALISRARVIAGAFRAGQIEIRNVDRHLPDMPCRQHKVGARLSLPVTTELLWNRFDRKIRNQVRKAQKEGLTAESGGAELLDAFYPIFARNMRDLGTPVFPRALFDEVLGGFCHHGRVFVVRQAGTPLAASIALSWRDSMLVPWASSLREFRHLCPNMLLYWQMLETAVAQGMRVFDFGRSTRGGGTAHFKQQWGATLFPLHWEFVVLRGNAPADQATSNPGIKLFIRAWQRLPLGLANLLGPRVIRHIA